MRRDEDHRCQTDSGGQSAHDCALGDEEDVEPVEPEPRHHQDAAERHLEGKKTDQRCGMGRDPRPEEHHHGGDEQHHEVGRLEQPLDCLGIGQPSRPPNYGFAHPAPSSGGPRRLVGGKP
jgi:hypothetical protein